MTFTRADGSRGMYYGWNSAASIDQVIAEKLQPVTPYRSLEFGVRSGGNHPGSRTIYTGAESPLASETNPWAAFKRLIGRYRKDDGRARAHPRRAPLGARRAAG